MVSTAGLAQPPTSLVLTYSISSQCMVCLLKTSPYKDFCCDSILYANFSLYSVQLFALWPRKALTLRMATPQEPEFGTIMDPVHGSIQLDKYLFKIIDRPEFQRLRKIKQFG